MHSLPLLGLTELALQPNVHCKVSGVFATDPNWTQQSVADVVQPVLDIFGMDRSVGEPAAQYQNFTSVDRVRFLSVVKLY